MAKFIIIGLGVGVVAYLFLGSFGLYTNEYSRVVNFLFTVVAGLALGVMWESLFKLRNRKIKG